ncbi:hypothetical protein HUJ04_001802 [Dendroctonus ponderosae]|nr:hypothetical protein HUJ04_001802 [Dendroctonus ponderosae]KAH1017437.1 hypothetical protein HUJ05_008078 [Dendroctonus ponderosae]
MRLRMFCSKESFSAEESLFREVETFSAEAALNSKIMLGVILQLEQVSFASSILASFISLRI